MPPLSPSGPDAGVPASGPARRLALYAVVACVLAVCAAVVCFARGSLLGVVWVLLAGLASNMAWYYTRRARPARAPEPGTAERTGEAVGG